MLCYLLDTDHWTLLERGSTQLVARLAAQPVGMVGVSVVTVEESLRGRVSMLARRLDGAARILRYSQLLQTVKRLNQMPLVSYDQPSEDEFQQLLALRLRVGHRDLKIAAIALANKLTLLTRNKSDFSSIPGLVIDDWSK